MPRVNNSAEAQGAKPLSKQLQVNIDVASKAGNAKDALIIWNAIEKKLFKAVGPEETVEIFKTKIYPVIDADVDAKSKLMPLDDLVSTINNHYTKWVVAKTAREEKVNSEDYKAFQKERAKERKQRVAAEKLDFNIKHHTNAIPTKPAEIKKIAQEIKKTEFADKIEPTVDIKSHPSDYVNTRSKLQVTLPYIVGKITFNKPRPESKPRTIKRFAEASARRDIPVEYLAELSDDVFADVIPA